MSIKKVLFWTALNVTSLLWAETDWEKAAEFRKAEKFSQAEHLLKQYSSPASFDAL